MFPRDFSNFHIILRSSVPVLPTQYISRMYYKYFNLPIEGCAGRSVLYSTTVLCFAWHLNKLRSLQRSTYVANQCIIKCQLCPCPLSRPPIPCPPEILIKITTFEIYRKYFFWKFFYNHNHLNYNP